MPLEEWALVASVVFSGLLAMLTTILHPMMAAMAGSEFASRTTLRRLSHGP